MSTSVGLCVVCESPASLVCTGCYRTYYCGNEHQTDDWTNHQSQCCPFEIQDSPELGYHLVARRNLEEGDVIVVQDPLVIAPVCLPTGLFCVGCYCQLRGFFTRCPRCNLPACEQTCPGLENPTGHGLECILLSGLIVGNDQKWPGLAFELRCLLSQIISPESWEYIKENAPFAACKRVPRNQTMVDFIINATGRALSLFFAIIPDLFSNYRSEILTFILDILDAHSFDIHLNETTKVGALYSIASLLQPSCAPNTRQSFDVDPKPQIIDDASVYNQGRVTVTAATKIARGEVLTFTKIPTTMTTLARQGYLQQMIGMRCFCTRCLDPVELGTNYGTISCPICPGWVLPIDAANIAASEWKCNGDCGVIISKDSAASRQVALLNHLKQVTSGRISLVKLEEVLKRFEKIVHPNNWYCVHLKRVMMKAYSIAPDMMGNIKHCSATLKSLGVRRNPVERIPDGQLKRKAALCRDILHVVEKVCADVFPDDLVSTADVLLNLASAEAEITKRAFASGQLNEEGASKALEKCQALLSRAEKLVHLQGHRGPAKALAEDIIKETITLQIWPAEMRDCPTEILIVDFEGPPAKIPRLVACLT